jgi:sugar phosphate isomerase/epimerase
MRTIGCVDNGFPRLSHPAALAVIRDLGFSSVDLCVMPGGPNIHAEAMVEDPAGEADSVLRHTEALGLRVSDVFMILGEGDLAVNHPDPAEREESLRHFRAAVELARRVTAPGITLLPGVQFDGVPPEESLALAAHELTRRVEEAGAEGLRVSVEAHVGSVAESPTAALELLERAPGLWLTLDHSHFLFQGYGQEELDPLVTRTRHVQIRQAARGMMQAPVNRGTLNLDAVRQQLEAAGFDGVVSVEYLWDEWLDCNRLDVTSETAELRDLLIARGVASLEETA